MLILVAKNKQSKRVFAMRVAVVAFDHPVECRLWADHTRAISLRLQIAATARSVKLGSKLPSATLQRGLNRHLADCSNF